MILPLAEEDIINNTDYDIILFKKTTVEDAEIPHPCYIY